MTQHLQLPPGRRLDAMVAMCLGWRWYCFRQEYLVGKEQRRFLREPHPDEWRTELATVEMPLKRIPALFAWNSAMSVFHWSTDDESAFGAALKAGVLRAYKLIEHDDDCANPFVLYAQLPKRKPKYIDSDTPAHVLCLGILAIQPEGKLDEYAKWLEGIE